MQLLAPKYKILTIITNDILLFEGVYLLCRCMFNGSGHYYDIYIYIYIEYVFFNAMLHTSMYTTWWHSPAARQKRTQCVLLYVLRLALNRLKD